MKKLIVLGVLAVLATSAAACGRMADLEAPQPKEGARAKERAPRDAWAPHLPDPATVNRPSSQVPIDGGPSNPLGAPAAGRDPQ
jgi:predicted small lipoprotein YifL